MMNAKGFCEQKPKQYYYACFQIPITQNPQTARHIASHHFQLTCFTFKGFC